MRMKKYTDEQLSRILGEQANGTLMTMMDDCHGRTEGHKRYYWDSGLDTGLECGCIEMVANNEIVNESVKWNLLRERWFEYDLRRVDYLSPDILLWNIEKAKLA